VSRMARKAGREGEHRAGNKAASDARAQVNNYSQERPVSRGDTASLPRTPPPLQHRRRPVAQDAPVGSVSQRHPRPTLLPRPRLSALAAFRRDAGARVRVAAAATTTTTTTSTTMTRTAAAAMAAAAAAAAAAVVAAVVAAAASASRRTHIHRRRGRGESRRQSSAVSETSAPT
jgi:hypothetical protein